MKEDPKFVPLVFRRLQVDSRDRITNLHILLPIGRNLPTTHCVDCKKGIGMKVDWLCTQATIGHCWIGEFPGPVYHKLYRLERRDYVSC